MKQLLTLTVSILISCSCFSAEVAKPKLGKAINLVQKNIEIRLDNDECRVRSTNHLTEMYCNVNWSSDKLKLPYGGKIIDISNDQKEVIVKNINRSESKVELESFSLYFKKKGSTGNKAKLKSSIKKNGILLKVKYQGPQF